MILQESDRFIQQEFSFVGKNCQIEGVFHFQGPTHIVGEMKGKLTMEDDAPLYIGREGKFKGEIKCFNIEIYGDFEGELEVNGKAVIHPLAKLSGVVKANQLIVSPGSVININGNIGDL